MRYILYVIWGALFGLLFQFILGYGVLWIYIVGLLISFLINNAAPSKNEGYPFLRFGVTCFLLLFIQGILFGVADLLIDFFTPNALCKILILLSFIFGIVYSFGRIGNGTWSNNIQFVGAIGIVVILLITSIAFWWKGLILFLLFRLPLYYIEEVIATLAIMLFITKHEKEKRKQEELNIPNYDESNLLNKYNNS